MIGPIGFEILRNQTLDNDMSQLLPMKILMNILKT